VVLPTPKETALDEGDERARAGQAQVKAASPLADLPDDWPPGGDRLGMSVLTDGDLLAQNRARLQADAALRDLLAHSGFSGEAYAMFEEELARYGLQVMLGWLRGGFIFALCRKAGVPLERGPIPDDDHEDLAQEVVAAALPAFRQKALREGGWRPDGGASLKTYFAGTLRYQFARVWRRRLRDKDRMAVVPRQLADDLQPEAASPDPGPAETLLMRDEVRRALAAIPNEKTRMAVVLAEDGYQHEEIAELLGPDVSPRAVEGLLRRHRQRRPGRSEK
jgi:DNA-directed RNA polymerase specialized sigma24 family protein